MDIKLKLNKNFVACLNKLKEKYGEKFERVNGFHNENLNFNDFIDHFIDSNSVADVSIDANANSSTKDVNTLKSDMMKPHLKLLAFNKIFYEITKKYGLSTAEEWLECEWNGAFYLHNASTSTYIPYCYAYDLDLVVEKGLFFIDKFKSQPAQHLTTYNDHVLEFISWTSNRSSGAVGLPSYLVYSYYFWYKDVKDNFYLKNPEYYRKQCFQKFIYDLNQPYLRVTECAFTNISIMDRNYLSELFGSRKFPNGEYVIDHIEEIIEHQKVFMETVAEIREKLMMTFPVLTFSLLFQDGKFVDEEFARWCNKHNLLWYDSNNYVGNDVTTLSNCPLSGDTEIFHYSDRYNSYYTSKIKEVHHNMIRDNRNSFKTISNGKEIECKINKFNIPVEYKIILVNGAYIKTTANHLNKVYGKDYIQTKDLTTDDYLPYGINKFIGNNNLSYEEGLLVGMFLGDGSYKNKTEVTFSLHKETDKDLIEFLHNYCTKQFGATICEVEQPSKISGNSLCINISVNSSYLRGLIEQFVNGNNALNKEISPKAYTQSIQFREGIIKGLYETDGGNSNRIYTSSKLLKNSLISLFATLGIVTNVSKDNRDNRLSNNTCYTIRYYDPGARTKLKDVYIKEGEYLWIKIKSIEKLNHHSLTASYCLEIIDNDEPIFTLANGIVTHNCRLLSDTSKLNGFINSIGGTSLSVGSVQVNTTNLRRIALESGKNINLYLEILAKRVHLSIKVLDVIRNIIKRNIEKGLLPNYTYGLIKMENQYNTIGTTATYEAVRDMGFIGEDEFGNKFYTNEGLDFACKIYDTINTIKDSYDFDYSINVECVPAERANSVLCAKDNLLYLDQVKDYLYSNQWIPLVENCTLQEKIRLGSILDIKCGGGQISHFNLQGRFANEEQAWDMLNLIAKSGVIYSAYNIKISVCEDGHGFYGDICPICGKLKKDVFSRIVGYLVPTQSYSKERKQEFENRRWFLLD